MALKRQIVAFAAVGALFGVAAEQIANLYGESLFESATAPKVTDSGRFRSYARLGGVFREMQSPVEPIVPRDHAVLYCFRQQQKFFAGNMRVDREADGSVFVMMNRAIADPTQLYDRQTMPPADYRILRLQRDTRLKIGAQMQDACQNMWAAVPTDRKVTELVQTIGL
ncbi:MAG: hypothetical protein KBA75_03335 [Alphaproteobacteria bacterium]|nr:hypothetical protein [Alphaproteobacteria bacterium]